MSLILVCFGSGVFKASQKRLIASAEARGVQRVHKWTDRRLRTSTFFEQNRSILQQRRGCGYWLWKPFIIREALAAADDDDVVLYIDSGVEVTGELAALTNLAASSDVVLFRNHGYTNHVWTKRDAFVLMACDSDEYHHAPQVNAAFMLFRKSPRSLALIDEWLGFSCDARILTDMPNTQGLDNFPDFSDHRHDQSILSLLAAKYQLHLFRDPSMFGNHAKMRAFRQPAEPLTRDYSPAPMLCSPYGTVFNHHRYRRRPFLETTTAWIRAALRRTARKVCPSALAWWKSRRRED